MISYSSLGNHGRLSNQIFQLLAVLGTAERNQTEASLPHWEYEQYFDIQLPHNGQSHNTYHEPAFEYQPIVGTDLDLYGYFQSSKYFPCQPLRFAPACLDQFRTHEAFQKPTIGIHVRRGDYVGHTLYFQLPITWFLSALVSIPDWQSHNIVIVTDDIPYCKLHFGCLPNVYFPDGTDIEDMAIYSLCDIQIMSNSSFSWFGAYFGKGNAIHSGRLFAGAFAGKDIQDFYEPHWKLHADFKLDLTDTTFTIPVYMDSKDRAANLSLSVCMLQQAFHTTIVIGEQGSDAFSEYAQWATYRKFDLPYFHRTKMLNDMALSADTDVVVNYDCDVLLPPMQLYLAVFNIRNGADMVFPYDGRFSRWDRKPWHREISVAMDLGVLSHVVPVGARGKSIEGQTSVGGCVLFSRQSFIDGGMENENMISFGPEDCERNDRFTTLSYTIARVPGALYHIDHWCGPDSSKHNPYFLANHEEIERVRGMDKSTLRKYVDGWEWVPAKPLTMENFQKEINAIYTKYDKVLAMNAEKGIYQEGLIGEMHHPYNIVK